MKAERITQDDSPARRAKPFLWYCSEYPLGMRGGVSVLIETLIQELHQDFRIGVVSPDSKEELLARPVGPCIDCHISLSPEVMLAMDQIGGGRNARRLMGTMIDAGADIIHFHAGGVYAWGIRWPGGSAFGMARRAGIQCFWSSHLVVSPLMGFCAPYRSTLYKLAMFPLPWTAKLTSLSNLSGEVSVSRHDEQKIRKWFPLFSDRVLQIYHSRIGYENKPGAKVREKLILNVGHLAIRKGQHYLAEAFAGLARQYPEWKLALAGHDADQECLIRIRKIIEENHLENQIEILGPREDAMDIMRRAEIYVQPSIQEALGLALQEALDLGCACVGTTAGGIPELIENHYNGLLVAPGNVGELRSAIEQLIVSSEKRSIFGSRGRSYIREKGMTAPLMAATHRALYHHAISHGGNPGAVSATRPRINAAKPSLAICMEYPIDQRGGTEVLVRTLIEGLSSRFRIYLVSGDATEYIYGSHWAEHVRAHLQWNQSSAGPSATATFNRWIERMKPDLVHFHFGGVYSWNARNGLHSPPLQCALSGWKTLVTNHGAFSLTDYLGAHQPLWLKATSFLPAYTSRLALVRNAFVEVTVSKGDCESMNRWFPQQGAKFRQVYHSRMHQLPPPSTGKEKLITCLGTIGTRKGQQFLAEAFARIAQKYRDWRLVIAGRTSQHEVRSQIQEIISQHDLTDRIQLPGEISDEDASSLLSSTAIFVIPSLGEGLGLSLQEALAHECAAVGSKVGGIPELIDHESNGLLVEAGNVDDLVVALDRLMGDPHLCAQFGKQGRKSIREKGMEATSMVKRYCMVYDAMLAERQCPSQSELSAVRTEKILPAVEA